MVLKLTKKKEQSRSILVSKINKILLNSFDGSEGNNSFFWSMVKNHKCVYTTKTANHNISGF